MEETACAEAASATRLASTEDEHRCGCGCGDPARAGGDFKDWEHYARWKRDELERIAREARPLYEAGLTLDEIAEARPHLPKHRVHRAFVTFGVPMRRRGKRPIHRRGRYVKCAARGFEWCPHGEAERWVYASDAAGRRADFLSPECWARYRSKVEWHSLAGLVKAADKTAWQADSRRRWGGRIGALEKGGRTPGKLSHWNEEAPAKLADARRRLERLLGRPPSLRELERATGYPRSTISRLSQ